MDDPAEPVARPGVFLGSLDSERLSEVRRCRFTDVLVFNTGKVAVVATVDPPIVGQDFDRDDLSSVILTARHEGTDVTHISEFPCFVHVGIPVVPNRVLATPVRADQVQIIGWGELYRSAEDAKSHKMG